MSFSITDSIGREIRFFFGIIAAKSDVSIGEYKIPFDQFAMLCIHFLKGGLFDREKETPDSINDALNELFAVYEKKNKRWQRKK